MDREGRGEAQGGTVSEFAVRCQFCKEPVDPNSRLTWHRVTGWERPGKHGGSDIRGRQQQPGFAHDDCLSRYLDGTQGQGTLL